MKIRARIFTDSELTMGAIIEPPAEPNHYLISVMRLKSGENVALFNGRQGEWIAEFIPMSRRQCQLKIITQTKEQPTDMRSITLNFALLKKTSMDFLMQKSTELGVTHFQPVITERTQSENIKISRLNAQIIEASEQCERLHIPTINEPISLDELLAQLSENDILIYGNESGDGVPISGFLSQEKITQNIQFLMGPEGGFSSIELAKLKQHNYTLSVGLGPRILRAETAALAAVTAFQLYQGDWNSMPKWSQNT